MEIWLVAESYSDGYYGQSFINPVPFQSAEKALSWIREVRKKHQLKSVLMMSDIPEEMHMVRDWPNAEDLQRASIIEFAFSGDTSTNHIMMRMLVGE
jgi:hypothetical protein